MKRRWIRSLFLALCIGFSSLSPGSWGRASNLSQDQPAGPIYIVQEGDSLWDIALRFRVTMDELALANGITDPNQLVVGAQLVIPGLEGIQGVLITRTISYGETLTSLSRVYRVPKDNLIRLNHLTNPAELYVGSTLVVPEKDTETPSTRKGVIVPGQSLLLAESWHHLDQ